MEIIAWVFLAAYLILLILLIRGNLILRRVECLETNSRPKVSVLVPFCNEERNLASCIQDLRMQDYPKDKWELLLIDDHSTDQSLDVISKALKEFDGFYQVLELRESAGKKRAIDLGIAKSSGTLILCTDADCRFNSNWLSSMQAAQEQTDADFLIGPVKMNSTGFFGNSIETEFAALIASTSGAIAAGFPFLCNGANLLYKKELYNQIQPFAKNWDIASGDDVFFLHEVIRQKKRISFASEIASLVRTQTPPTTKAFFSQRIRWAKKSTRYTYLPSKLIGMVVFGFNCTLLLLLFSAEWKLFVLFFSMKFLCDLSLLFSARPWLGLSKLVFPSFVLSLWYPVYFLLIALLSLFSNPTWKHQMKDIS